MKDYQEIIDRYYPVGTLRRDIYMRHCRSVADLALEINRDRELDLDECEIETAAMLHDIGIFMTDAPGIGCDGTGPYIAHGVIGARLLRDNGYSETIARVAERHTGAGLTVDDIERQALPLPHHDMLPEITLERLVCYADKFYSKGGDMRRKPFDAVRASMARHGEATLSRFDRLAAEFGVPRPATS